MGSLGIRCIIRTGLILPLLCCQIAFARDVVALFDEALAEHIPDQVVEYKTVGETGLNLHIFHPEDPSDIRHAAILWLHGGGWKAGNAEQLFPHAAYYAKLGYVGISADYRLAGNGQTIFDCIEDVRDAYYWIYQNAASLGIDPQRIIVGGESAGGHLAGCIGYIADDRLTGIPDPQPYPAACILVNPIVDMTSISWAMTVPGLAPGEIALAESISPLFHVDPLDPPALLLHGLADTVVPPAQSTDFATALQSVGQVAKLRLWEGKGHAFFLYLPEYSLIDKPVIQLSLLQTEAILQAEGLNGFPVVDGHFAPVHLFAGPDGFRSFSELVSAGGLLYGSTYAGGADNAGTLFMYDPATHAHTVLREFAGPDGREVFNGLAIVGDVIFGVGKFGGDFNRGTLFSVSTDGTGFQVLHYFGENLEAGFYPHSAPILIDNVLYGTTYHGGSTAWGGTLYRFSLPDGPYEILHSFTPETGRHPTGQLVQVGDWLYGTASDFFQHDGGYHGSLYRLHRIDGTFELLHQFNGASEGGHPYDDLYHDGADKLYGTTFGQVANPSSKGTIFVYSISNDTLTVLHDFSASLGTGSKPNGALIADQSGNYLYGLSHGSNAEGGDIGTLYRIKPDGTGFTLLHRFASGLAGNTPMRSLVRTQGRFFGVTAFGGLTVDTANPETGGGFIFQYTPVDAPSDARVAYVEWLAENGLLVNQSTESDEDSDGLSLLEEFAYVGIPDMADQPREITLSGFNTGSVEAVIPVIRSTATPLVIPLISTDLQNWEDATGSAQATITDSESNPGLQTMSFQWPDSVIQSGPFFIRFELDLDN